MLYGQLTQLGVGCAVVAPTLVPAKAVDRVKTDRRDAEKLARSHRSGDLTAVWVPDGGSEALRDLVRALEAARQDQLRAWHRVRVRWVTRRTAIVNQIRGLLLERGITLRKGRQYVDAALPGILEDADSKLSGTLRALLAQLKLELDGWRYGWASPMRYSTSRLMRTKHDSRS